ncbi:MAG: glycosyltransferase family 4 protein [Candidatus Omnitrophota bacterium]
MNILQIVSSLAEISGPANSLYLVATGLKQKGHNVVCAHYVGERGPLVEKLENQGIKVINLGGGDANQPRFIRLRILIRLIMLVFKEKIEIIQAHNWDADCYALLAGIFKKMRKVVSLHSRSYFDWVNKHYAKYDRLFFKLVDNYVCVSQCMADEFKEKYPQIRNKISVIYNSPAEQFFKNFNFTNRKKIREEFNVSDQEVLIGSVGNFTRFKGIEYLLEALNNLSYDDFKVLLVGQDYGNIKNKYNSYLKDKPLKSKIIFAGFRQDIRDILDALDIFVFPSTEEVDPIALSEAMARGKTIISTIVGGIPEKVENKKNGILVEPKNSASLRNALEFCLKNPAKAQEMAFNARQTIHQKFSYEKMVQSYLEVFKK